MKTIILGILGNAPADGYGLHFKELLLVMPENQPYTQDSNFKTRALCSSCFDMQVLGSQSSRSFVMKISSILFLGFEHLFFTAMCNQAYAGEGRFKQAAWLLGLCF